MKFGRIQKVTLKQRYAFIQYESHEAAVEAIKEMDSADLGFGERIQVVQSSMY